MNELKNDIDLTKIYNYADELANLYRQEILNANAVASRNLLNFKDDVVMTDDGLRVDFLLPLYYEEIEVGRGKTINGEGGVVYPAIKKWIETKGIIPRPDKNGITPTRDQLAVMITKKIHRVGYKGKHPLERALKNPQTKVIVRGLCDEIGNAMNKQVNYDLLQLTKLPKQK